MYRHIYVHTVVTRAEDKSSILSYREPIWIDYALFYGVSLGMACLIVHICISILRKDMVHHGLLWSTKQSCRRYQDGCVRCIHIYIDREWQRATKRDAWLHTAVMREEEESKVLSFCEHRSVSLRCEKLSALFFRAMQTQPSAQAWNCLELESLVGQNWVAAIWAA